VLFFQQKTGTGNEELEYRNQFTINEDMPGKSLTDHSGEMLFLCPSFENKQRNRLKSSRPKRKNPGCRVHGTTTYG